jgi:hypothetical protein
MGDRRPEREQAAYQFHIQAGRLGYRIIKRISPYKFRIVDIDDFWKQELVAIVLPTSFDFYTYRLFKRQKFDILVVQRHNAIVPVNVIDMDTSIKYFPGDHVDKTMRENIKRRNADEKAFLLSQIIAGTKEGKATVESMPGRMRRRYLREARSYLKGPVGRPFAS